MYMSVHCAYPNAIWYTVYLNCLCLLRTSQKQLNTNKRLMKHRACTSLAFLSTAMICFSLLFLFHWECMRWHLLPVWTVKTNATPKTNISVGSTVIFCTTFIGISFPKVYWTAQRRSFYRSHHKHTLQALLIAPEISVNMYRYYLR